MTVTTIDEHLLRHLYAYDRTLPLLATSEPDVVELVNGSQFSW